MAARRRGQAPPLRATGQLRAGVGTRPYTQAPQGSPPGTEPRKQGRPLWPPTGGDKLRPYGAKRSQRGQKGGGRKCRPCTGCKMHFGATPPLFRFPLLREAGNPCCSRREKTGSPARTPGNRFTLFTHFFRLSAQTAYLATLASQASLEASLARM